MNSTNILQSLSQKSISPFVMYNGNSKKKTKDLSKISSAVNHALKTPIDISQFSALEKKNIRKNLQKISKRIDKRNQKVKFVQELKIPIIGSIARCLYRKTYVTQLNIPQDLKSNKKAKNLSNRNDHLKKMFQDDPRIQILEEDDVTDMVEFVSQTFEDVEIGKARLYLCLRSKPLGSHIIIIGKDADGNHFHDSIVVKQDGTLHAMQNPSSYYPDLDSLIEGECFGKFFENVTACSLENDSRFKGAFASTADFRDQIDYKAEGPCLYFSKDDGRYHCIYDSDVVSFEIVPQGFLVNEYKKVFATVNEMVEYIEQNPLTFDW